MSIAPGPRPIDRKRWRHALIGHLEDFPRQLGALRFSTEQFGLDFDKARFAEAFESDDPALYTRVQAVERGFGRVQNYMASMAEDGAKLAELKRRRPAAGESKAQPDFEALRDAKVIGKEACRKLVAAQKSRSLFEHGYIAVSPDDFHAAVAQVLDIAPQFLDHFSTWIEPYLVGGDHGLPTN